MLDWIVRTVLLCFVVGVILSFLDIDPASILTHTVDTVRQVADIAVGAFHWALPYILIGAVIVVPLSLIAALLRWSRGRTRP